MASSLRHSFVVAAPIFAERPAETKKPILMIRVFYTWMTDQGHGRLSCIPLLCEPSAHVTMQFTYRVH